MGRKRNRRHLQAASASGEPVMARRNLWKADHLEGFVVGVGAEWAVLHLVTEVQLSGWTFVRLDTIREVECQGPESFLARAVPLAGVPVAPLSVDLDSVATILQDTAKGFPLVTVNTEADDPLICYIGRPLRVTKKRLHLLDISTQATWDDEEPRRIRLDAITRIDVGGRYEQALHALGGNPPLPN